MSLFTGRLLLELDASHTRLA
ncbi:hypothetical protein E2C01_074915 [Portunus trituberculatus]|uniref:Uncharacterized protein n=1 Tax=Portunus trituberculatus TaxID=210409 RepID=A0A5B7IFI7_PORTR|nr:hypothetical protein [Portunus trituberculatus]